MCKHSHNTSDERYRRIEAKIQNTIDTLMISGDITTKVTEFCVLAEINHTTFYSHYENISAAFLIRDKTVKQNLKNYLVSSRQEIRILYLRMFRYIKNHETYFRGTIKRRNIGALQTLMETIKPAVVDKWDCINRTKTDHIYYIFTFEVTCEYSKWIECENFDVEKVDGHVKRLMYLTETAVQRLGKYL